VTKFDEWSNEILKIELFLYLLRLGDEWSSEYLNCFYIYYEWSSEIHKIELFLYLIISWWLVTTFDEKYLKLNWFYIYYVSVTSGAVKYIKLNYVYIWLFRGDSWLVSNVYYFDCLGYGWGSEYLNWIVSISITSRSSEIHKNCIISISNYFVITFDEKHLKLNVSITSRWQVEQWNT
jgi:hypothetical protein